MDYFGGLNMSFKSNYMYMYQFSLSDILSSLHVKNYGENSALFVTLLLHSRV